MEEISPQIQPSCLVGGGGEEDSLQAFLVACQNSGNVQNFLQSRPHLVSAFHTACASGNIKAVKTLTRYDSCLCLFADSNGMFPLHIATIQRNIPLMRILLEALPECIEMTNTLEETALLLAAKNGDVAVFQVLLESAGLLHNRKEIFAKKDASGNNVLHYAVGRQQYQMARWLLVDNLTGSPLVRVNSLNGDKFTALDLHFHNSTSWSDTEMTNLLRKAGAKRAQPFCSVSWKTSFLPWSLSNRENKILLTMSSVFAGSAFSGLFNLEDAPTASEALHLSLKALLLHPGQVPDFFYSIMFMTMAFVLSMIGIVVGTWLLIKRWSLYLQPLLLVGMSSFFCSYALTMERKVPKFSITTGFCDIPSFWLVWLYGPILLLNVLVLQHLGGLCRRLIFYDANESVHLEDDERERKRGM